MGLSTFEGDYRKGRYGGESALVMRKQILLLFFVFAGIVCPAGEALAQADKELVRIADEMYNFGDITGALDVYKQALNSNPENVRAQYMAGICYMKSVHKKKAVNYLLEAYELDPSYTSKIEYKIGRAYQYRNSFDSARKYYRQYKTYLKEGDIDVDTLDIDAEEELKKIERRIYECDNGEEFVNNPVEAELENLGDAINSRFSDYGPVISSDEDVMYFTSRREDGIGKDKARDNNFFEDIYVSRYKRGQWQPAQNLGKPINTKGHDATTGISPGGDILFIYRGTGDIFICRKDRNGNWRAPEKLDEPINTDHYENSITISPDGNTVYFSSDRPGGKGGADLYKSTRNDKGNWTEPVNLGPKINTEYDEEGPFLDINGNRLYFSSSGHKGMGGFDIFYSDYDSSAGEWSEPTNIGYPVNSAANDIYFVISGDGKHGYYATVTPESRGKTDIYQITMPEKFRKDEKQEEEEEDQAAIQTVNIKLKVKDRKSDKLVDEARVEVFDPEGSKEVIQSGKTSDGVYEATVKAKAGAEITVSAEREGYVFETNDIYVPDSDTPEEHDITHTIKLKKVEKGVNEIIRNIYFDFNKASFTERSYIELNKLLDMMKEHPGIKVMIGGHTCNIGSKEYNKKLSQKRAQVVVDFLVENGIDPSRLEAKGFGEEQPIASNDDEKMGRELNRRTEFTIIED